MDKNHDLSSLGASGQGIVVERRDIMKGIALMASGAFATAVHSTSVHGDTKKEEKSSRAPSTSSVTAQDDSPVVDTSSGKVVGYIRNGICAFKGIAYGDTTEGANRFMPPAKPKAWNGVRSSRQQDRGGEQSRWRGAGEHCGGLILFAQSRARPDPVGVFAQ
jgi:para-nitrobenzyl esterase